MIHETCSPAKGGCRSKFRSIVGHVAGSAAMAVVHSLVFGLVLAWLWNAILPGLLGARSIGYWQSVGLLIMARILVGGRRTPGGHPHRRRPGLDRWQDYDAWWHQEGREAFRSYAERKEGGER